MSDGVIADQVAEGELLDVAELFTAWLSAQSLMKMSPAITPPIGPGFAPLDVLVLIEFVLDGALGTAP
jgi:hypothetical protein